MSNTRRSLLPLITVVGSLFLSLVAAELIIRLFDLAPLLTSQERKYVRDPHLPYKPRPFSVTRGNSLHRHNSFGFRDIEHSYAQPSHVFRILGLGDSFTYGAGAGFEGTYLYRLETLLNGRSGDHPRVEIIKAGMPRYFPETERLLLEHYGKAYSPDLVLVGFLPNDIIDTYFGLDAVAVDKSGYLTTREAAGHGPFGVMLYKKSHLLRLVLQTYVDYRIARKYRPQWEELYRANGFHEKDWRAVEAEYAKMVAIADQIHARVVVVHIPHRGPWSEPKHYPGKRLAAWAAGHGAGFVDTLPAMMRASGKKPLYQEDGHCTPDGYAVIAGAIYEYLTEAGLIP